MTKRKVGAVRGAVLVEMDADGFALDPDYRPHLGLGTRVTDVATRTRRGVVVGLDGWTTGRPELHCSALWIEWADQEAREHRTDLSGLLSRNGQRAELFTASIRIEAWEQVYRERREARAALLADDAEAGAPGPIAREAWLTSAPFRVTSERWSPDFDAYAAGEIDASQVRCVLCSSAPCQCRPCDACGWSAVAPGEQCPRGCVR